VPFPGLYDPATAGDISPLLSAFEAIDVEHLAAVGIDTCTAAYEFGKVPEEQLVRLERACRESSDGERVRHVLDELAWLVFDATLAALPARTLSRATLLASPREAELSRDHRKMMAGIRKYACADWMASA